ncbi:MAG: RHS repeat domain-containing protein [Bacteroidota bacterium]
MQDYYAFGMQMPGRKLSGGYRYGFNGKENDNEVKGEGNQQDYGMRIYDGRIGKFLSVDPITNEYPDLTPYQFASNTPIWAIDLDGLEGLVATGMPMGNSGGHGMILSVQDAKKVINSVANWFSSKHQSGMRNYRIAEQARQMAIKQGRTDGDGITWWTKAMVYIGPWWSSTAAFSDANDGAVLMQGKNLDGSDATVGDYTAAGVGIFIPFLSGSSIKNIFKGFTTAVEGYKYAGKTFKNAEQFEKALVKAGTYEDRVGMVQSVLRDVAKTNNWKKAGDLSKKTGNEFYDLGDGTFGSIDKLHGHFEVFKKEGKTLSHQGSINIDGVMNKERNKAYDIKL